MNLWIIERYTKEYLPDGLQIMSYHSCFCVSWSVADTNVSPFARVRNICCGHKFCVRDTKNVSDFVQKHFVSAANVSQFAQPKKHHGQQCVLVYQGPNYMK